MVEPSGMDCSKGLVSQRIEIGEAYKSIHRGNKFKNPNTAHRSIYSTCMAKCGTQDPFAEYQISPNIFLDSIDGRAACVNCGKSRKFFCYTCYLPLAEIKDLIPHVEDLPCKIDVIKHAQEQNGKSTSIHAAIVAPEMVKIYTYPEFPDYNKESGVLLVYPGEGAVPMATMESNRAAEIRKMVFIDSTWPQAKQIFKDPRLKELPCIILRERKSLFWRYQRGKPDSYLATIEAIYDAVVSLEERRRGDTNGTKYDGRFDNLLFFFSYFYRKVDELHFRKSVESGDADGSAMPS